MGLEIEVENVRQAADLTIGTVGMSSPLWLQYLHAASDIAATVAALGGAVLVALRVLLAYREWRKPAMERAEEDQCQKK